MSMSGRIVGATLIGLAFLSCEPSVDSSEWDVFRDRYVEWAFTANPDFAVYQGRHEFDGIYPDLSETGLASQIATYRAMRDTAASFAPERLDAARQVEREHLLAVIDRQLFWRDRADLPHTSPEWYLDSGALSPDVYLTRPYAPVIDRMRSYTKWARGVPAMLDQARANLRPPLARPLIEIGRARYGGLATYLLDDVPGVLSGVTDPTLQREFLEANRAAAMAFAEFDAWLEGQLATATEDFRLGPERFAEMLYATERVDIPLDRLEEIGRSDMARNIASLTASCGEYAPGATIIDCIAKASAVKPEGGPVVAARRQLSDLESFVRAHDIVSIPGTQVALVEEAPPHMRANSAYIDIPGPYEEALPSVYYIAPPDPTWSAEDQAGYVPSVGRLLFVSVHEVWPGHFLQSLHSNRAELLIGRVFWSYAFGEGWAHYTEEMMWDEGLGDGDPATHIGQLSGALRRNARFLSAIGLHAGDMTLQESERLFQEDAFQDPGSARQQAARGTYDPAYLNYTLGKLMIRKLREDWTASRGGPGALKEFHDTFLSFGSPPIPIVRRAMLGADAGPAL